MTGLTLRDRVTEGSGELSSQRADFEVCLGESRGW